MAEFPYMPLFTDAFISDTTHLSAEETGAYIMLLMCAWRSPNCRLPNDDKRLARFARCTPARWGNIKHVVLEFFTIEDDVWLIQKRIIKEHIRLSKKQIINSDNGSLGGRPKSLKNNNVGKANGSESETQTLSETKAKQKHTKPIPKEEEYIDRNCRFEEFWESYPKKVGKVAAKKAWDKAIKAHDPKTIIEAAKTYGLQQTGKSGSYIKHPQGWLNDGRFLDPVSSVAEPIPVGMYRHPETGEIRKLNRG